MDHSRFELAPGLWLDARRALWVEDSGTLAVADLHIGYAWAHRHAGQLLPLTVPDDTADRLGELLRDYRPRTVILVGDIVHRAVAVAPLRAELRKIVEGLAAAANVVLVTGNHDRDLANCLPAELGRARLAEHFEAGDCLFVHGDGESVGKAGQSVARAREAGRWIILGHEHPCVTLGDGAATWQKCPCFLCGERLVVLPAFSGWAAGSARDEYMSPLLATARVTLKVAVLGERLVPVRPD